ncbi:MAG: hypothetical protein JW871_02960, partial [Endomicrobiales bacterium]|nr:hypothetical protein [Endomicrobiales bacterium]
MINLNLTDFSKDRFMWRFKRFLRRGKRMLMASLNFKKIIATITLGCFVFTFVLSQSLHAVVEKKRETRKINSISEEFIIPYTAGRISDAKCFDSDQIVINIQDLHCHPEVQKNIAKILSILDEKYNLKKIYIEGAIGEVDTSWITSIKDKDMRQKVVNTLLSQGKLTGTEYYSIISGKPRILCGLEDETIYKSNILRLNKILAEQNDISRVLQNMENDLLALNGKYYTSKHKKLEALIEEHKAGMVSSDKYYSKLKKYADKLDEDITLYKNISVFFSMLQLQKELNFKKVSSEMSEFIAHLKQKLPYNTYKFLAERMNSNAKMDELYLYLIKVAKEYDIPVSGRFANLNKFFDYVTLSQQVNPIDLLREEDILTRELHMKLSESETEKEVVFIISFFKNFKAYYRNKISAEDYQYFADNLDKFHTLWNKHAMTGKISNFDQYSGLLNDFYSANLKRNNCFLKNCIGPCEQAGTSGIFVSPYANQKERVIQTMKDAKEIIVMVSGGFHTPGLTKLLESRRISYLVVTPNVTQDTKFAEQVYNKLAAIQAQMFKSADRQQMTGDRQQTTDAKMGTDPAVNVACRKGSVPIFVVADLSAKHPKHIKHKVSVPDSLALYNLSEHPLNFKLWAFAQAELTSLVTELASKKGEITDEDLTSIAAQVQQSFSSIQVEGDLGKVTFVFNTETRQFVFTRNGMSFSFNLTDKNAVELAEIDGKPIKLTETTEEAFYRQHTTWQSIITMGYIGRLLGWLLNSFWIPVVFAPKYEMYTMLFAIFGDIQARNEFIVSHESPVLSAAEAEGLQALKAARVEVGPSYDILVDLIIQYNNARGLDSNWTFLRDNRSGEIDTSGYAPQTLAVLQLDADLYDAFIRKDESEIRRIKNELEGYTNSDSVLERAIAKVSLMQQRQRERFEDLTTIKGKASAFVGLAAEQIPTADVEQLSAGQAVKLAKGMAKVHRAINLANLRAGRATLTTATLTRYATVSSILDAPGYVYERIMEIDAQIKDESGEDVNFAGEFKAELERLLRTYGSEPQLKDVTIDDLLLLGTGRETADVAKIEGALRALYEASPGFHDYILYEVAPLVAAPGYEAEGVISEASGEAEAGKFVDSHVVQPAIETRNVKFSEPKDGWAIYPDREPKPLLLRPEFEGQDVVGFRVIKEAEMRVKKYLEEAYSEVGKVKLGKNDRIDVVRNLVLVGNAKSPYIHTIYIIGRYDVYKVGFNVADLKLDFNTFSDTEAELIKAIDLIGRRRTGTAASHIKRMMEYVNARGWIGLTDLSLLKDAFFRLRASGYNYLDASLESLDNDLNQGKNADQIAGRIEELLEIEKQQQIERKAAFDFVKVFMEAARKGFDPSDVVRLPRLVSLYIAGSSLSEAKGEALLSKLLAEYRDRYGYGLIQASETLAAVVAHRIINEIGLEAGRAPLTRGANTTSDSRIDGERALVKWVIIGGLVLLVLAVIAALIMSVIETDSIVGQGSLINNVQILASMSFTGIPLSMLRTKGLDIRVPILFGAEAAGEAMGAEQQIPSQVSAGREKSYRISEEKKAVATTAGLLGVSVIIAVLSIFGINNEVSIAISIIALIISFVSGIASLFSITMQLFVSRKNDIKDFIDVIEEVKEYIAQNDIDFETDDILDSAIKAQFAEAGASGINQVNTLAEKNGRIDELMNTNINNKDVQILQWLVLNKSQLSENSELQKRFVEARAKALPYLVAYEKARLTRLGRFTLLNHGLSIIHYRKSRRIRGALNEKFGTVVNWNGNAIVLGSIIRQEDLEVREDNDRLILKNKNTGAELVIQTNPEIKRVNEKEKKVQTQIINSVIIGSYPYETGKGLIDLRKEWLGNDELIKWAGITEEQMAENSDEILVGPGKTKYVYDFIMDNPSLIKDPSLVSKMPEDAEIQKAFEYLSQKSYSPEMSRKDKLLFLHYMSILVRSRASGTDRDYKDVIRDQILASRKLQEAASYDDEFKGVIEDIMWSASILMVKSGKIEARTSQDFSGQKPYTIDENMSFEELASIFDGMVKDGKLCPYVIINIKNFAPTTYLAYMKKLEEISSLYNGNITFVISIERSGTLYHDMPGANTAVRKTEDTLGEQFLTNEHTSLVTDGGSKTRCGNVTNVNHGQFSLAPLVRKIWRNNKAELEITTFLEINLKTIGTVWLQMKGYGKNALIWPASDSIIVLGENPNYAGIPISQMPERFMSCSGPKAKLFEPGVAREMRQYSQDKGKSLYDLILYEDQEFCAKFGEQLNQAKEIYDQRLLKTRGNFIASGSDQDLNLTLKSGAGQYSFKKGDIITFVEKPKYFAVLAEQAILYGGGTSIENIFLLMMDKKTLCDLFIRDLNRETAQNGISLGQRINSVFDKVFGGFTQRDTSDPATRAVLDYTERENVRVIGWDYGEGATASDVGDLKSNSRMYQEIINDEDFDYDARRNEDSVVIPENVTVYYEGERLSPEMAKAKFMLKNVRIITEDDGEYELHLSKGSGIFSSIIRFSKSNNNLTLTEGSVLVDCEISSLVSMHGPNCVLQGLRHTPEDEESGETYDYTVDKSGRVVKEYRTVETVHAYSEETTATIIIFMKDGTRKNMVVRAWNMDYKAPIGDVLLKIAKEQGLIDAGAVENNENKRKAFELLAEKDHPMLLGVKGLSQWQDIYFETKVKENSKVIIGAEVLLDEDVSGFIKRVGLGEKGEITSIDLEINGETKTYQFAELADRNIRMPSTKSVYLLENFGDYDFEKSKETLDALAMRMWLSKVREAYRDAVRDVWIAKDNLRKIIDIRNNSGESFDIQAGNPALQKIEISDFLRALSVLNIFGLALGVFLCLAPVILVTLGLAGIASLSFAGLGILILFMVISIWWDDAVQTFESRVLQDSRAFMGIKGLNVTGDGKVVVADKEAIDISAQV